MERPTVTVVMPIKNEGVRIERSLRQLEASSYPHEKITVFIVDGMSTDDTREVVGRVKEGSDLDIRILDNPKGQRASALNIGIREASSELILRIDARTIIDADYITRCVDTLLETGADNAGGVQKSATFIGENDEYTAAQHAVGAAMAHPFGVGNAQFRLGKKSGFVDTVYLGCFRRAVFDKVGLFDEDSPVVSEDSDMNERIRAGGGKVYLNKDIIAYYVPRDKISELWKLYYRYGGCRAGNLLKNKRLTGWRQLVPTLFILSLVALPVASIFNSLFIYLWCFIVASYIEADLMISLYLTGKNGSGLGGKGRLSLFFALFRAFPAMHFSWAFGFWRRLLQRPKPGEYWGY